MIHFQTCKAEILIFEISGFRILDQFWKDFLTKPIIFTNFQASATRFLISRAQMEEFSRETFRKPSHDVYEPLGVDRTDRQTPICDLQREKTSPDPSVAVVYRLNLSSARAMLEYKRLNSTYNVMYSSTNNFLLWDNI